MLEQEIEFKFKRLNDQGAETSMFNKKGRLTATSLILHKETIEINKIVKAIRRFDRLLLQLENGTVIGLVVRGKALVPLMENINRVSSLYWAVEEQNKLDQQGRGREFRIEPCTYCGSAIQLTKFAHSEETYCGYCETVVKRDQAATPGESDDQQAMNVCDGCGYYSRPREFGTFYFYFLLIVYGFSHGKKFLCGGCCRGEAWKMFAANFIFLLGLPFAIIQLVRVYLADRGFTAGYAGLDKANLKARKGKTKDALERYESMIHEHGDSCGLRYNRGLALAESGSLAEAGVEFEKALDLCSNYGPAVELLAACYQQTGNTEGLEALTKAWSDEED